LVFILGLVVCSAAIASKNTAEKQANERLLELFSATQAASLGER
jgi:hypothetical protein